MSWTLTLSGTDVTALTASASVTFAADNVCGEITVELADRSALDGLVLPRVPRTALLAYRHSPAHPVVSFFLEEITKPEDLTSRTATLWGRTLSARLTTPWAQKISKQWAAATTIDAIVQELAAMCGVTVTVTDDFSVCQYCYAVSDQTPAEIIRDLAARSGQILWPQADGSLLVAPRQYAAGTPDVVLSSAQAVVESVTRTVPDFGNRILVSGDGAVAGLSVQVVPIYDEDSCVAADGQSTVRLLAVVLGTDGEPVAGGTAVSWSTSGGLMLDQTSQTAQAQIVGETVRADSYRQLTLALPAVSVVGVYAYGDVRRTVDLYRQRRGSVSGRVVTFASNLDFFDQALVVDYLVSGAEATWQAGWTPGDVTVTAAVAGAQGQAIIHQGNPSACASSVVLEAGSASPCLGDVVPILAKVSMFGGPGVGPIAFRLDGCGSLTSTRKTLGGQPVTETLRVSQWGGVSQVRLSAVPEAGSTPAVVLTETPGDDLYLSHDRQTVLLSEVLLPGTQVTASYTAGGTALIGWRPAAIPTGNEQIAETVLVTHAEIEGVTVAQVTLSRTPAPGITPVCMPQFQGDHYDSHEGTVVNLSRLYGELFAVGTSVACTYESVWLTQPGCSATITATVQDGSQDGGSGTIAVTAKDCREVGTDIPDEGAANEEGEDDPQEWPDLDEPEEDPEEQAEGCDVAAINSRTGVPTGTNWAAVSGVSKPDDCPGLCTCDQICAALRSTGKLAQAGLFYSQCMSQCTAARTQACTQCSLSGPSTLAPGAEGTWTDGKGNAGEWKGGGVDLIERTPAGYKAKMPMGGAGPFTVQACYGGDARQCCEAQVAFPPCSLTGPSSLSAGQEGEFIPSLGMSAASATVTNMEIVRQTATAFVAKLKDGKCIGSINVFYGGSRLCGSKTVTDPYVETVGVVVGPATMEPGETAYFAHTLGAGAVYTGSLPLISQSADGTGAILMMPEGASGAYTASWTGRCGVTASKAVVATGVENLLGTISFAATACGTHSLSHTVIGDGNYYTVNRSWWSPWDSDRTGTYWTDRVTISVSGSTLNVIHTDDPCHDNRGSITVDVYRTA